jgi:hypothetical protein
MGYYQDELEREKAHSASLRNRLEDANEFQGASNPNVREMIPRPKGTAGTHFSIQVEMGLSGSTKKYDKYKAIQVRPDSIAWTSYLRCRYL